MHEFSLAEQILESVLEEIRPLRRARVARITLRAGPSCGVEPASLAFALESLAAGTQAEGAEVIIRRGHDEAECPRCGRVELQSGRACPLCGAQGLRAAGGEIVIEEIELEEENNAG